MHGIGSCIKLSHTHTIIDTIRSGDPGGASREMDSVFGFEVVNSCPGVPSEILIPGDTWTVRKAFDGTAKKLGGLFIDNFNIHGKSTSEAGRVAALAV